MKGLTTGIVLCTLSASVSAQPEYTVVDLGSFGGDIAAVDINDAGVVVGWGVVNRFDYQMFRYDGVLTAIAPLQPQTQAQATLASVDGSVVGAGYSMTDLDRDALVSDGVNTVSPGMFTPTGSDSSGRLVGITPVTLANGFVIEHACEYSDGTLSVLPLLPGGADSAAFDTDDSGWIVGGAFPAGALKPTPALHEPGHTRRHRRASPRDQQRAAGRRVGKHRSRAASRVPIQPQRLGCRHIAHRSGHARRQGEPRTRHQRRR